jgi:tRNA (guanine37-N1)-methyltransferase
VITLFPEMIEGALNFGVLSSAAEKGLVNIVTYNPRDFTEDRHRSVDDRPFGGGDGMVMLAEPLQKLLKHNFSKAEKPKVCFLSPQGKVLTHAKVKELSSEKEMILICGRYAGIDQRFINQFVDEEISIGDYVLSGGEVAALAVIDAVSRQIPGVLGHQESAQKDSFAEGLLEAPSFTRPPDWEKQIVPEILLSGNHLKISQWRFFVSCLVTLKKREDIFWKFEKDFQPPSKRWGKLTERLKLFWESDLTAQEKESLGLVDFKLPF